VKRFASLAVALGAMATGITFVLGAAGASASGASASSTLPTLTLAMNGKSPPVVGGSTVSGGVNVVSTVTGEAQAAPTLIRLDPGVPFSEVPTLAAMVKAHGGDLNYLDGYASVVFSVGANKGTSSAQTMLAPGNYVAIDENGKHLGPAEFTVSQSPSPATLPTPGATIASIEFGFNGARTLHRGELVRFVNDGFLVHMIIGLGVKNVAVAKQLIALLIAGKDNKAMKLVTSMVSWDNGVSTGGLQQEVITQKPGIYVIACFMNTQDGREHTQLGMERLLRIVK